jgi:hypothetical protein
MTYAETTAHGNYVTVRITSRRWSPLAGPFMHRRDAENYVDAARAAALAKYRAPEDQIKLGYAGYGVARLQFKPGEPLRAGNVNTELGLQIDPVNGYVHTG